MTALSRSLFGSAILAALVAGSAVADGPVTVVHQGFCINREEMRCNEVALPGTMVAFDRLMKLGDGTRAVYFFSDLDVDSEATLVHVLESEDLDGGLEIVPADSVKKDAKKLEGPMKKLAAKFQSMGGLRLTAFKAVKTSRKPNRVFTELKVTGPGFFAGRVVDLDGNKVPTSDRTTFSVIRRPQY